MSHSHAFKITVTRADSVGQAFTDARTEARKLFNRHDWFTEGKLVLKQVTQDVRPDGSDAVCWEFELQVTEGK